MVLEKSELFDSLDCCLTIPALAQPEQNPLNFALIKENELADDVLKAKTEKCPCNYFKKMLGNTHDVFCYVKNGHEKEVQ